VATHLAFEARDYPIGDVLFSTMKFRIPRFQRPYAWGEDQLEDFWNDLLVADGPPFLGSFILNHESVEESGFVEVIDGQQRMLTITILMAVIRDLAQELAFLFFVERVDLLMRDNKSVGLLIGDHEHDRVTNTAAEHLSAFRAYGTPYDFGREITNLIDTVHFSHSHLSRMLQLADVYVWALQLCATSKTGGSSRAELAEFVRKETNLLQVHRCKWWPTKDSWMLTGNR